MAEKDKKDKDAEKKEVKEKKTVYFFEVKKVKINADISMPKKYSEMIKFIFEKFIQEQTKKRRGLPIKSHDPPYPTAAGLSGKMDEKIKAEANG